MGGSFFHFIYFIVFKPLKNQLSEALEKIDDLKKEIDESKNLGRS